MNFRACTLLAGCFLLAGCVTAPGMPLPPRAQMQDFALEARFFLRVTQADQVTQSSGGRLSWAHSKGGDRLMIANPLGVGLAEIEITPSRSHLRTANGKELESTEPDALMEAVTGQALPVSRLPAWLLGRAGGNTLVERDASGRPLSFFEAGWYLEYTYGDETAEALPLGLTLRRPPDIELRLRFETWKDTP